ncbi:M48 family metalloprotease [Natrialba sp. INN-245]|uniref:M48 family metalloprotease n=1 Tax=Natrialba sp. INN-245 TaxID=2690967 RepID=UPI0013121200|nr:M48 family metalloprotease [Natrialba sp. INN-245]MWV40910.1 M48 family metalloprotease [Natrialba sp. INN-245]
MIDLSYTPSRIVVASGIGWLLFVTILSSGYLPFVVRDADGETIVQRIQGIAGLYSVLWTGAGVALLGYGVFTLPSGPRHEVALVGALAVAGVVLGSTHVVVLSAFGLLEYAGLESPLAAVRSVLFQGTVWFGGGALAIVALGTAPLAAVCLVAVGVVGFHAAGPAITEWTNETTELPSALEGRLRVLSDEAGFDDVRFRVLSRVSNSNAAVSGILPGRRTIYVTEAAIESLSERELESLVAHELGHLDNGHLRRQALGSAICWSGYALATAALLRASVWAPLLFLVTILVVVYNSNRAIDHEFEADAFAAAVTSPTETANTVERLYELDLIPKRHSGMTELFYEHPSLERRLEALEDRSPR